MYVLHNMIGVLLHLLITFIVKSSTESDNRVYLVISSARVRYPWYVIWYSSIQYLICKFENVKWITYYVHISKFISNWKALSLIWLVTFLAFQHLHQHKKPVLWIYCCSAGCKSNWTIVHVSCSIILLDILPPFFYVWPRFYFSA